MAEQLSMALVNGATGGINPVGILNNTNVVPTTFGTTGVIEFEDTLQMQTNVANANPPAGDSLRYLTSPFGAQILRNKPRIGSTSAFPVFVQSGDVIADVPGSVVSPNVPTTSMGSGTLETSLLYGDFEQVRHLIWGNSAEILVDPWSLSAKNQISLITVLTTDIVIPRPSLLTYGLFMV